MTPHNSRSVPWPRPLAACIVLWAAADIILMLPHSGNHWMGLHSAAYYLLQDSPSPQHAIQMSLTVLVSLVTLFSGCVLLFGVQRKGKKTPSLPIAFAAEVHWMLLWTVCVHFMVKAIAFLVASTRALSAFSGLELQAVQVWMCTEMLRFMGVDLLLMFTLRFLTRPQPIPVATPAPQC